MLEHLQENSRIIENAIIRILADERKCTLSEALIDAEEYSLLAGGKRIRSTLCLEFYKLFGGKNDISELAACLELVHTFSLIHDDMPDMDNDDLRRGKPTCHKQFGNANALLAGDGLAILPYKIISDKAIKGVISHETANKLMNVLSKASGNEGMICGQMIDLWGETHEMSMEQILQMYARKTGALIKASCLFGAILAGADKTNLEATEIYAGNIGLSFQLVDDLLNLHSSTEELGKPVGTDEEHGKSTLVSKIGEDKTKQIILECKTNAINSISEYDGSEFLIELVDYLTVRKN